MNFVKFIFKLIGQYNLMDTTEYARSLDEGMQWYKEIRTDAEAIAAANPMKRLLIYVKIYSDMWYGVVGWAVAYFFATIWLRKQMNPARVEAEAIEKA